MCWCNKKKYQNMDAKTLSAMQQKRNDNIVASEYKLVKWKTLNNFDLCPYCNMHIRYYCKNWCIEQ